MSLDLFRLDWILIDTVIIILLLVLLFSVKVFKEISRWRFSLSNESLNRIKLKNLEMDTNTSNVVIKSCSVIKKRNELGEESSKVVVFLGTKKFKRKLVRILTEGLGSYGFHIVRIDLKIKSGINNDSSERNKELIIGKIISKILEQSKQENLITSSSYCLIHCSNSSASYKSLLSDENNARMILINPRINKVNSSKISELVELEPKFHLIFSKKSHLILNNNSLKIFLKDNPHNNKLGIQLNIIEKSRKSFKYYETILLGIILNILEKKNKK